MSEFLMKAKTEEEADRPQELVRCKDCKHRGNYEMCVLAAISKEKDYPLFIIDNRGEWFCADGERKPTQTNAKNNALDVR